jgi:UDP-N-acetylmuramoyl-tripeptide--D-alanyl-D-alanine ligase
MFTVGDVCQALRLEPVLGLDRARELQAVVYDSRRATPGCLFVALRGEEGRDGWSYVPGAVAAGAAAVLAERPPAPDWAASWGERPPAYFVVPRSLQALSALAAWWRSRHPVRCIAITGSVGKSSAKEALYALLSRRFRTIKSEASLNNEIGVPVTLMRLEPGHERLIQEMGTYGPGEIRLLCALARPTTALVTNVGPSHLERMGSFERIALCKGELVESLPPGGTACLNFDDPHVMSMARRAPGDVITYGLSEGAELRGVDVVEAGIQGVRLRLRRRGEMAATRVPIPGRPGIWTALAAAAAALAEGLTLGDVADGLAGIEAPTRLVPRPGRNGSTVLDDYYNSSPASARAALDVLAQSPAAGRKIVVFADMLELGALTESGHREVATRIAEVADHLIAVGPLASRYFADEARRRGLERVETYADADEVELDPAPGDLVLVKGSRGMRMERLVSRLVEPSAVSDQLSGDGV